MSDVLTGIGRVSFGCHLQCPSRFLRPCQSSANQLTFKHPISATSKAGQLRSGIQFAAAAKMATVNMILISSQNMNPSTAALGAPLRTRVMPHAIKALGPTTAIAPQRADHTLLPPCPPNPARSPYSSTIARPTAACAATTRQGDTGGWFARHACASSRVRALNAGSPPSSSQFMAERGASGAGCAHRLLSETLMSSGMAVGKTQRLYVETRVFPDKPVDVAGGGAAAFCEVA